MKNNQDDPSEHPVNSHSNEEDAPKFGRLLVVLALAVILITVITFVTGAYYSN